jgi:hypothetical protein
MSGCGTVPVDQNTAYAPEKTPGGELPFSTKEPDVYQGNFFVGTSDYQKHWFVAKKGGNWRIDFFDDNKKEWSQLKSDALYYIDHKKKIYAAEPQNVHTTVDSPYFTSILSGFFKNKENRQFEDLGEDGGLHKYRVRGSAAAKDESVLYVDVPSGVVVKQEFLAHNEQNGTESTMKYVYEIKDLSLNVDDSAFQLPADYKQVSWEQYSPNQSSTKQ